MTNTLPVACSLSDPELQIREATILARFKVAATQPIEISNGYSFEVPGDKQNLALIFELMAAERECCPFLTFELTAVERNGPLSLRITGPAGTKELLRSLLFIQVPNTL